jgi:ABC-type branched-subunit amino acid transport system substrate-binding protein
LTGIPACRQTLAIQGIPIPIGVLHDFPPADGGAAFEWAVRLGIGENAVRLPGSVELIHVDADGLPLPGGSEASVRRAFEQLEAAGVLAVLGPAISDNAIVVQPLADAAGLVTLNYAGAEATRGRACFHYQIGSLEDEPSFLAAHLLERGLLRVALVQDSTFIGRRMSDFFAEACLAIGVSLVARVMAEPARAGAALADIRAIQPDALVSLGLWDLPRALSLELRGSGWDLPACANSALIYGHHSPEWARDWEGWTYCDTVSEANPRYRALVETATAAGQAAGPGTAGAVDMGRLLAEAIARAHPLTRAGVLAALERVKSLPATSGRAGTLMGFGAWDRGALKGEFIVIRQWRDGRSVEWNGDATSTD